jgi:hypothetical protein
MPDALPYKAARKLTPLKTRAPYGFNKTIGTDHPLINLNENYFISKKTLTTVYIDSINPNENARIT